MISVFSQILSKDFDFVQFLPFERIFFQEEKAVIQGKNTDQDINTKSLNELYISNRNFVVIVRNCPQFSKLTFALIFCE